MPRLPSQVSSHTHRPSEIRRASAQPCPWACASRHRWSHFAAPARTSSTTSRHARSTVRATPPDASSRRRLADDERAERG